MYLYFNKLKEKANILKLREHKMIFIYKNKLVCSPKLTKN